MRIILLNLFFLLLLNCSQSEVSGEQENMDPMKWDRSTRVEVMKLNPEDFRHEIISPGNIKATKKAEIQSLTDGFVKEIYVKNGDKVNKGDRLVGLVNKKHELALRKARDDFWLAETELQSLLLGVGSDVADSANIPSSMFENLKRQSGISRALIQLEQIQYEIDHLIIRAPFNGRIYNLDIMEGTFLKYLYPVCNLVSDENYYVDFKIFESESFNIFKGLEVEINIPVISGSGIFYGDIISMDPIIDENGLISLRAEIKKPSILIKDGMKAQIAIIANIPGSIVVPKTAVVTRMHRQIIFTIERGKAIWNEVKIDAENSSSFLITEGLNFGDSTIITGNLGLLHHSMVSVVAQVPKDTL